MSKAQPSSHELEILGRFERWVRRTFNADSIVFQKHVPFTAVIHNDCDGNLMIDRGRMMLLLPENGESYVLKAMDEGVELTIASHTHLEQVLLIGLQWALIRTFQDQYE